MVLPLSGSCTVDCDGETFTLAGRRGVFTRVTDFAYLPREAQATVTFEFCAREASQIFGGLSYSRGGQGAKVERLYRDVRAYAIPGGSEEIMLDLSIRQALRVHKALGMKL